MSAADRCQTGREVDDPQAEIPFERLPLPLDEDVLRVVEPYGRNLEIMREIDAQIEAHKRECGGGDDEEAKRKAEEEAAAKAEQEKREAEELERKAREAKAVMRMRLNLLDLETEEIDF